ncbi:MAG: long-chain fatty acid--CoA ligase [Sandaracinaceae bacterium]|nr:long-chain fatty acid--CoA ligase [Sandaracinaceae bacterium]
MSDLSILRAAAEVPDRPALIDARGVMTFAELAARAMDLTQPTDGRVWLAPRPARDDLARIVGALERRVGLALLHARWTAAERDDALARTGATEDGHGATPAAEQLLLFTSGSAGRPKIVRIAHDALVAAARMHAAALPWEATDRAVLCLPLAHAGGLSVVTRALYARRPVILAPERFDSDTLWGLIDAHQGTITSLVPAMLAQLTERAPPRCLRAVLLGGDATPPVLLTRARERGWPLLPTYGATETCGQAATQRLGDERAEGVGPPLPGVRLRLGPEDVIEVHSPARMLGYLDDDSPLDAEGWYRTGDVGRLDREGHLHVLGRSNRRIITGGENIDPLEVEAALLAHPGIAEAAVVGIADPTWGQRVAAMIAGPRLPSDDELRAFLRPRLADFKRPRVIVRVGALPRTPSGKLDRARITGALAAPSPPRGSTN